MQRQPVSDPAQVLAALDHAIAELLAEIDRHECQTTRRGLGCAHMGLHREQLIMLRALVEYWS